MSKDTLKDRAKDEIKLKYYVVFKKLFYRYGKVEGRERESIETILKWFNSPGKFNQLRYVGHLMKILEGTTEAFTDEVLGIAMDMGTELAKYEPVKWEDRT